MGFLLQRMSPALPPVNAREVLRYARAGNTPDSRVQSLLEEVCSDAQEILVPRVCYTIVPAVVQEKRITLGKDDDLTVESHDLAKSLQGCTQALLFVATIGLEVDRLIALYGRLSPGKALLLQALGAERIEALCDAFCHAIAQQLSPQGLSLRPRFSPGYGDLPLAFQTPLLTALDSWRQIGVSLNDSLLMSPSKSVSALAGITTRHCNEEPTRYTCGECAQHTTCPYAI